MIQKIMRDKAFLAQRAEPAMKNILAIQGGGRPTVPC